MKKRICLYLYLLVISITGCQVQQAAPKPAGSYFEVHYMDVGQADAALVLCDGKAMLIDGGNRADSSLMYSYLEQQGIEYLDYLVSTHPHEDHAGGLAGALNYAAAGVVYAPMVEYDSDVFRDFKKYLTKQEAEIVVPAAGDSFSLGSAEVTVLGPVGSERGMDLNNKSLVLRIVYGTTSFLFTGDAEREEEQAILEAGYGIQSTVLKVGHHGGADSTTYPFLREAAPEYAVISVGEENTYGHPTQEVLSRLRDAEVEVYRTDLQGTVVCTSDGEHVSFQAGKQEYADLIVPETEMETKLTQTQNLDEGKTGAEVTVVLNTSSMKFHNPVCSSVSDMKESNKEHFVGDREALIQQGYVPCKRCEP